MTVTESFVRISWGGTLDNVSKYIFYNSTTRVCKFTSNVIVRKSTVTILSIQGNKKNKPGPLAPPDNIRPRRKITARWYS